MDPRNQRGVGAVIITVLLVVPIFTQARSYSNENFFSSYHYKPITFTLGPSGSFTGTLANGSTFTQAPVVNERSIRLHKFTVDDAFFYTSDKGFFRASSDLIALSIYSYLATV
jgi:hypothetical protein